MYEILAATGSAALLEELNRMHIWGELTGFRIQAVTSDYARLLDMLREHRYHLVLLQERGEETLPLLRAIRQENLSHVAVISEYADYRLVRKAFLMGAEDYLVAPLEVSQFIALFSRIENADHGQLAEEMCHQDELITLFENQDGSIHERLDELFYQILARYHDESEAIAYLRRITEGVVSALFDQYDWLGNYYAPEDFLEVTYEFPDYEQELRGRLDHLYTLYTGFTELYPPHGEQMEPILRYILGCPEGDLKQKSLAETLHINRTYFSTVFNAQVGTSFVDYVNTVRIKRAAYLLRHTDRKVSEIAASLDYHDMGYFLKRFKAHYGMTPSQYRIPESYEFQI